MGRTLTFYKYQGAGNDFVMIDNREGAYDNLTEKDIKFLCDRNFGIGSDGLIALTPAAEADFTMAYHNSDGRRATMCGNGGRCAARFARDIGLSGDTMSFEAADGLHRASIGPDGNVQLAMRDCAIPGEPRKGVHFIDTGSPHLVLFVPDTSAVDVPRQGASLRHNSALSPHGANVNFCQPINDTKLRIRTFERGVEAETLACGTGSVAAAITAHHTGAVKSNQIEIETLGGRLCVTFEIGGSQYRNVVLAGPARRVFEGKIEME